jgi:hypothetical protein
LRCEHGLKDVRKALSLEAWPQVVIVEDAQRPRVFDTPARLFGQLAPKSLLDRFVRFDAAAGKDVNAGRIAHDQDLSVLEEDHRPRRREAPARLELRRQIHDDLERQVLLPEHVLLRR